jgi:hypothetical protein
MHESSAERAGEKFAPVGVRRMRPRETDGKARARLRIDQMFRKARIRGQLCASLQAVVAVVSVQHTNDTAQEQALQVPFDQVVCLRLALRDLEHLAELTLALALRPLGGTLCTLSSLAAAKQHLAQGGEEEN